jgi:hypothetical protein
MEIQLISIVILDNLFMPFSDILLFRPHGTQRANWRKKLKLFDNEISTDTYRHTRFQICVTILEIEQKSRPLAFFDYLSTDK